MRILKRIVEMVFIFLVPLMLLLFGLKINKVYDDNNNLTSQYLTYENGIFREYKDNITYKNYYTIENIIPTRTYSSISNGIDITSDNDGTFKIVVNNPTNWKQLIILSSYNFDVTHKYLVRGNTRTSSNSGVEIYFSGSAPNDQYEYIRVPNSSGPYDVFLFVGSDTPNGTYYIKPQVIDLTESFGLGYEPIITNVPTYFTQDYYNYNEVYNFTYESNDIISSNHEFNYTWYNNALVSLSEHLQFNNNFMIQFIFIYVILIMLNLLLWYVFYVPFDMLFGLLLRKLEYYK